MNCKPGQLALVIKPSLSDPCSHKCLGLPVTVEREVQPDSVFSIFMLIAEGPSWWLKEPFRCPSGKSNCRGIDRLPDSCLRPFDPESAPEPELADTPLQVPHEV